MLPALDFEGFDWDDGNTDKCRKHGVTLAEIEALFDSAPLVSADPEHSRQEERLRAVGQVGDRHLFVAFTMRTRYARRLVRPISARYMHREEIERYERQTLSAPEQ